MTDASTTSRPLFNRQQLISLFLPLVAEQALSISIGLADTLMVSSVGEAAVSGVSLVDSFNVLMIQLLSALATGGAVVASQYIGHREPKRAKASAAQIMFIMISLSVVTAVIVAVGRHAILRGIFGSIDADVMRYAETYFLLSALSYPFIGVYNAGAALFRAQGNSKISMLSSLVMNVVNIGGNAILIYGFGMGVMGAATASLVSRSLVDSFNVLMIQLLSALATGGAVVASQYIGHREPKRAKASAAQIMFIMISLSVVTAVIVAVGRHAILRGIFGSIDADVMRYAETYFLLSALSYPFIGVYNAGAALFRAQGNSKISMLSSLVMNVVNIGGNAILIYGFGMGVMGAATASLVSRMIACFTVMFLLQKPDCALRIDHLTDLKPDLDLIKRILKVGIPAGIENGMFQIGKLSVSSLTSTLGTAAIAANAVAGNISSFLNVPASAVGIGALTVVGQCLGAGEKVQAKRYSRLLLLTAYAGDWLMNLSGLFFLNKLALSWFNLSPDAYGMALELMVWFNVVSLILWPSSFTLPNILRAAGDAAFTMTVSVISMWVFRVAFCYLMVLKFHCGLLFIWMGMFLDWAMRSLFFCVRFVRGRWMEQKVI